MSHDWVTEPIKNSLVYGRRHTAIQTMQKKPIRINIREAITQLYVLSVNKIQKKNKADMN